MRAALLGLVLVLGLAARGDALAAEAAAVGEAPAQATPRSYKAQAIPSTVQLGMPFVYEVEIIDDPSIRYELPRDLRLGTLAVRRVDLQRVPAGEELVTRARIELAIFDALGAAELPELVFTALGPAGVAQLSLPAVPIVVESVAEGEELDGLRAPQELRIFDALPIWIGAGLLATTLAVVVGMREIRRRRAARPAEIAPPVPPEERALAALDALEAGGAADLRAYYFALSDIVRGFLEESGVLRAREMTTAELVDLLVAREVPGLSLAQLGAWLERGDLHRFARLQGDAETARADTEKAREIVRGVAAALRQAAAVPGEGEAA